jgi:hypothetical protein
VCSSDLDLAAERALAALQRVHKAAAVVEVGAGK